MLTAQKNYAAFISYRHNPRDREWATRIFDALETFQVPKALQKQGYPIRLGRLYRDEDEVPASADLSDQIKQSLAHSSLLIVVCSPDTPHSKWVRREIALFQEMGKGDRIIPLLVAGEPEELFPPDLLRRRAERKLPDGTTEEYWEEFEPIAADVRPRKHEPYSRTFRRAKLRLAAAILGVTYDDLYQREHEREKANLRRIAASAAALLLAAGVGGALYWNTYLRTQMLYCSNYGERWGVPFCVGEMSEAAAQQQGRVYQLKTRAGLPRELTRLNGSFSPRGDNESDYEAEDWTKDAARFVYEYQASSTASLSQVSEFSRNGKLLRRLSYDFSEDRLRGVVRFERDMGIAERQRAKGTSLGRFNADSEDDFDNRTNIGQHRLHFDGSGLLLECKFEPYGGGKPANDMQGAYGSAYSYSFLGLPETVRNLDSVGDTLLEKTGVAEIRRTYDAAGHLTAVSWYSKNWELATNQDFVARVSLKRDRLGRIISIQCFSRWQAGAFERHRRGAHHIRL